MCAERCVVKRRTKYNLGTQLRHEHTSQPPAWFYFRYRGGEKKKRVLFAPCEDVHQGIEKEKSRNVCIDNNSLHKTYTRHRVRWLQFTVVIDELKTKLTGKPNYIRLVKKNKNNILI